MNRIFGYFRIAIINSGGIRSSIEAGNVTLEDLLTAFPFQNTFDVISIKGKYLREALEHSVASFDSQGVSSSNGGGFLQVAGLKIVYDLQRDVGARLVSALVVDGEESEDLDDDKLYNVVLPNYVISGGDGFTMFEEHKESIAIGDLDTDVIKRAFDENSPIKTRVQNRITIYTDQKPYNTASTLTSSIITFISLYNLLLNHF